MLFEQYYPDALTTTVTQRYHAHIAYRRELDSKLGKVLSPSIHPSTEQPRRDSYFTSCLRYFFVCIESFKPWIILSSKASSIGSLGIMRPDST